MPPKLSPIAAPSTAAFEPPVFVASTDDVGGFFKAAEVGTKVAPSPLPPASSLLNRASPEANKASSNDDTFVVNDDIFAALLLDVEIEGGGGGARETSGEAARANRSAANAAVTASFNPPVETASVLAAART
jgi:hypothetical protein